MNCLQIVNIHRPFGGTHNIIVKKEDNRYTINKMVRKRKERVYFYKVVLGITRFAYLLCTR